MGRSDLIVQSYLQSEVCKRLVGKVLRDPCLEMTGSVPSNLTACRKGSC